MSLELVPNRPPIPPGDLINRVAPPFPPDRLAEAQRSFDMEGLEHLRYFERALASQGRSLNDFDRLLDFGCGCGRFIRHFGQLSGDVEIHGTDIDAEMIGWLKENVPYSRFEVAPHEPPLPYPDHHFDLIINHSVFSHLDERLQDLWLAELRRITQPGGLLLLTVEGESSWARTVHASEQAGEDYSRWQCELESRGILFIRDDMYVGSTHPDFYHSTVHAPWYVFEHWGDFFDIAAYLPDGSISQDLVVLRRPADGAPARRRIGRSLSAPTEARASAAATPRGAISRTGVAQTLQRAVAAARGQVVEPNVPNDDTDRLLREINMLRVGLYEQGERISVIAAQLREEIARSGNGHDGADASDE
jgi:SAM-dependent methyltransferase